MKRIFAIAFVGLMPVVVSAPALADHERGRCYDGECYDQEYDQWNSDQNNHNRRNRGAFSPGPFTDSPVDAFNNNNVCLPGSTCNFEDRRQGEEPPQ